MLADIPELITIGLIVISFIGWIIGQINEQKPPPRRPAQAGRKRIRDEIEVFLEEAARRKEQQQPGRQGEAARQAQPARQAAGAQKVRRPPPKRRPQTRRTTREQQASRSDAPSRPAPEPRSAEPKRESVADHVQSHIHPREPADGSVIKQSSLQQKSLDVVSVDAPVDLSRQRVAAAALIADIRTPSGIRKAIMLNEILQPPLCNRPKRLS